ncbi:MAG: glycosyltransferase [Gammaproteobacteria bacterium]|nr:glycosyltransferase [Gammaproteobacteria bacterium]
MNNGVPLFVSVIVPVFNDQAGIDRCVDALTKQSYPLDRYEIIVVDNNSEPPIHIQSDVISRIQLATCSTVGSYAARNVGIDKSHGEVLAFTDADCVPEPDWIKEGVAALLAGGSECLVGGAVLFHAPESRRATELYQYVSGFPQRANVTERGFAATANLFGHRKHFDRVGLFNTELLSGGDLDWCLRAAQHGIKAAFCEAAIVVTSPRADLFSAIRQARRVAGGRVLLGRSTHTAVPADRIKPHRKPGSAIGWILKQRELSLLSRLRVLFVASLIKLAHMVEVLRLRLGGKPERR